MAIQYWWNQPGIPARKKLRRNKILAFKNSYHGDTFGAMSVSDRSVFTLAFHDLLFEVVFIDTPTAENLPALQSTIQNLGQNIAAFIYEPLVQGAGGIKMYDAGLLNKLLQVIKQQEIICIADEVMTGFGRTGHLFASEYVELKPDIICLSKGLTGGTMALGVTACTNRIYDAYVQDDKLKTFFHGHSFTANPLACTAALASLDLLQKQECQEKIRWITGQHVLFGRQLQQIQGIRNIRALGTIIAFEMAYGTDEYLNDIGAIITQKALQQGVYLRPLGNTVYIMPPYCITNEELASVYSTLLSILQHV